MWDSDIQPVAGEWPPDGVFYSNLDVCWKLTISGDGRTYACTRRADHKGPHVACYHDGKVCCPAWSDTPANPSPNAQDEL